MSNNTSNTCIDEPMPTRQEEKTYESLSPFEFKNQLINMAREDARCSTATFLNAGRGNPNWIATAPRDAFFLLGRFAMAECRRVMDMPVGIAGIPVQEGSADRFRKFIAENAHEAGAALLGGTFAYLVEKRGADPDELAHEWAEGIMGDQYPTPDRVLKYTEVIVRDYLAITMGNDAPVSDDWDIFATEGSTAGMCYVFDSLQQNFLLNEGDGVALMTPIFTPYIDIPQLDRFRFKVTNISANRSEHDGYHTWQYPDSQIDKLRDPSVKLVCIVNPSNPPSYALDKHTVDRIIDVVRKDNPNLMIVTDDVYGTFVEGFRSLMYELPYNTMCLYSFSKYFGATGWRVAAIALNRKNIFDDMIAKLPDDRKADLDRRYGSITDNTSALRFIDRMVADSRMVALNHTAGLSTPQQIQMSLFAGMIVLDKAKAYQKAMIDLIQQRLHALWKTTGFTLLPDKTRAGYYSEIDIMVWAKKFYGNDFGKWLAKTYEPVDFVVRLAREYAVVLLNGDGFDGPSWSVRTSLANLNEDDYLKIGTAIRQVLDEYHDRYTKEHK